MRKLADSAPRYLAEVTRFDITDEYHVHAYMALCFVCDECAECLEISSAYELPADEWCVEAGAQARAAGWYVPPADAEGRIDGWTCYCPPCAPRTR